MTTMSAISPTLTRAGLRAVFNASNDGLTAQITHIALGSSQYTPTGAETTLKNEQARIEVAGGRYVDDYSIEVSALLDTDTGFTVAEVGLVLEDGTLLAVWSDPDTPLAAYTVGVPIALACFLAISQLPTEVLSFSGDPDLNLFFGSEFAQLVRAHASMALLWTESEARISALEKQVETIAALLERQ
nr:phage tail protein [uncultured Cohaesibacter sp.]